MIKPSMDTKRRFKILIADDHAIVRRGLAQIVAESSHPFTIEEAADGDEALAKIDAGDFDLILVDITMPGTGGIEVVSVLKKTRPQLPVLVLSMHPEEQYAHRALRAGASGYVTKDSAADELLTAMHRVLDGGSYISESLAGLLSSSSSSTRSGRDLR